MVIEKSPKCIIEIQKIYNRYNVPFDAKHTYTKILDDVIGYMSGEGSIFQDIDVEIADYEFIHYVYDDLLESVIDTDLSITEDLILALIRLTEDMYRDIIKKIKTTGMMYVRLLNTSIIVYKDVI